jgi:hypothetical protein
LLQFRGPWRLVEMRSIMEVLLRDHYHFDGDDLFSKIQNARGKLPSGVNHGSLHHLRMLANSILHYDSKKYYALQEKDQKRMEKEIVRLLKQLRALIEGAPAR